jgi:branched-subunit amino acid aminotransferase/4-amino-4-deoxychorismate lyase
VNRSPVLIETVRVRDAVAPLWSYHVARVVRSCREIGVPPPRELLAPEDGSDRIVRLSVSATGVETSERPVGSLAPVRLHISSVRHEPYPHKTTDRAVFDRARAEAEAVGADDGVLLVAGGWVAETAIWGLYWWEGERLCAPPVAFGLLRSVARQRLGELLMIEERRRSPAELAGRPLFVANAARGVVEVSVFDGNAPPHDPRIGQLAGAFWP